MTKINKNEFENGRAAAILSESEARLLASRGRAAEATERFLAAFREKCGELPRGGGFFKGGSDAGLISAVCFLIGITDRFRATLREEILALSQAERSLAAWNGIAAAEECGRKPDTDPPFFSALREKAGKVSADIVSTRETVAKFCAGDLPELCARLGGAADLSGEGKHASTASVTAVCGELRFRTEKLLAYLKENR